MKYANGHVWVNGKQKHAFICAKTQKKMIEILKNNTDYATQSYFQSHWNKCGNDIMKSLARDKEGLWICSTSYGRDYIKLTLKILKKEDLLK
jgi:hypothetical protein